MWKSTVISASERIFPGLIYHDYKKEIDDIGNQIQSNLLLQISLYFNVWLLPVWLLVLLYNLDIKYGQLSDVFKVITVAVLIAACILECARLYLGYYGNLAEKIPELASFWLISTLLQLPLEVYLLVDGRTLPHKTERVINGLALCFLIFEIIIGMMTLKVLAAHSAKRFYLAQTYVVENTIN